MRDENLSLAAQESLLTLLCTDDVNGVIIRNVIPVTVFEGRRGEIAREVYSYIDRYHRTPRSNLEDVLDSFLSGGDRRAKDFKRIVRAIYRAADDINPDYIMSRLDKMLRYWTIKSSAKELFDLFQGGLVDDEALDSMEKVLNSAVRQRVETFDAGTRLGDKQKALGFLLKDDDDDVFLTGIKELDAHNLGPRRKGLHLFIGLKKTGKTWWLVNTAKQAFMQGLKVLHITLEMSEEKMTKRYYQSFFAIAKKRPSNSEDVIHKSRFKRDRLKRMTAIRRRKVKPKVAMDDRSIRKELTSRMDRFGKRLNRIYIKEFPTRQLTFGGLVSFLDRIEQQEGFVPDMLIVDYPKLMKLDPKNFRMELSALVADIRGIAVERNLAAVIVDQAHRAAEKSSHVTGGNIGEDFSQLATTDVALTYSQTKAEHALGLARIYVDAAREELDKWEVLISQNYAMGQFCVDSVRMRTNYGELITKRFSRLDGSGEED